MFRSIYPTQLNKTGLLNVRNKFAAEITSVPEILQGSHFPTLDGLRGISIIIVLLNHIAWQTTLSQYIDGAIGVQIFFVISGFLITTLLLKEKVKKGRISLRQFYIRRVLRIVPVAYLYIFVILILNYFFKLGMTFENFLVSTLYLKNLNIAGDWYTGHFWTLSVEEQFYLIFPFLLRFNVNRYTVLCIILILLFPIIFFIDNHKVGVFYSNPVTPLLISWFLLLFGQGTVCILVGSLFSILLFKKIINAENFKNGFMVSFLLFAVAVFLNIRILSIYRATFTPIIFSILISVVILQNLSSQGNFFARILNTRFLVKTGVLSYSLYIWQQLFTHNQPWKNAFPYADNIVLNLILLVAVASASYYLYEKKFLILKNRFK